MAKTIILGAGVNGLTTAMLLARDGHEVTVLERDAAEPPAAGDAWEAWGRRGVSQFRRDEVVVPMPDELSPPLVERTQLPYWLQP